MYPQHAASVPFLEAASSCHDGPSLWRANDQRHRAAPGIVKSAHKSCVRVDMKDT